MAQRFTLRALLALAASLAILSGALTASAAPPMLPGMDQMQAGMQQDIAQLKPLSGKEFEIAFMEKMLMHHQSAIEMAQMVPSRATHPELIKMAQDIVTAQQQEVTEMRGWLKSWYGVANPTMQPMPGMDQMMPAMMAMKGADFEQAFMMMMSMHHEGAIGMAGLIPGRTTRPELLTLSKNIIASQQKEVDQMRQWGMAWYGFDPTTMPQGGTTMPGMPNTGVGGAAQPTEVIRVAGLALAAIALLALAVTRFLPRRARER